MYGSARALEENGYPRAWVVTSRVALLPQHSQLNLAARNGLRETLSGRIIKTKLQTSPRENGS